MRLNKTQKFWLIVLIVMLALLIFVAGIISGVMVSSVRQGSDSATPAKSASDPSGIVGMMTLLGNAITRPVETASEWLNKKKKASEAEKQQAANENKKVEPKAGGDKSPEPQSDKAQATSPEKKKPSTTRYWVEADSFALKTKASDRAKELKAKGYNACIVKMGEAGQEWYAVQIGDFETEDEAARAADEFKKKDGGVAVVNSMFTAIFEQKKDCKGGEGG
jgi:cell division protein FtsN